MPLIISMAATGKSREKYRIVEVLDDKQDPGIAVRWPSFLITKIPGTKKELSYLKEPTWHPTQKDLLGYPIKINENRWAFMHDEKLTKEQLDEIKDSQSLVVPDITISDVKDTFTVYF